MSEFSARARILDVGCGADKIPGAIGIDCIALPGVDILHDLNQFPWPFKENEFDLIVFCHSISHLSDIAEVLQECQRILSPKGEVEIVAPHYSSDNYYTDPTHKFSLGVRSMSYFSRNNDLDYQYVADSKLYELLDSAISFREFDASWRSTVKYNPARRLGLEFLVNRFPRIYERFFAWSLPASEVYFKLKKSE